MANGAIRGITVEIGGDTTKLGKALEDGEKHSRSLQTELRQVEKLLKFDPGNVDLLNQKQKILADTISETSKKLDILKEAEKQVIAQFEKGDIGEDQLRAFQREVLQTEKKLDGMREELTSTEKALGNLKKTSQDAVKETKDYKDAVADAKEAVADFKEETSGLVDAMATGGAAIGGATVAAAGYALNLSTEFDKAFNTLITKTGASSDEMDALNESMERVYANNFGESIEDVANSMATVKTNTKLSGEQLENATERAILLRDTFEFDVNESTRSAKMLMDQYGLSAEDAFNLIAQGAQNGLDKNGDLLDTVNEYAVHFKQLGIDAPTMFNMLVNGAESGTFSVDKLGDAVKEFGIRVKDGSDTTADGFAAIGLDADTMSAKFAKGGDDAAEALNQTVSALFAMKDPIAQNTAGVNLFGTMWEDLGVEGVRALMDMTGEIDTTNAALDTINEHKYDDIGSALQGLGRTIETDVVEPLGDELKPVVEDAIDYVKANAPQIKDIITQIVTKVGEFIGFIVDHGAVITSTIAGIGAAFVTWKVAGMISSVVSVITSFIGVLKTGTTVMGALNAVMNLNPAVLIVTAIVGLVAAFITLWNTSEGFRNFWINLWNTVKSVFSTVADAVVNFFTVTIPNAFTAFVTTIQNFFTVTIPNAFNTFVTFVTNIFNTVINFIKNNWGALLLLIVNPFAGAFALLYNNCEGFRNFVNNFVQAVKNFFVNAANSIVAFFTTTIPNFISRVVAWFNTLPAKIGYALGFVIGKLIQFGQNAIKWVTTNVPIIINKVVTFFSQLPGKIWTFLVNVVTRIGTWCTNMKTKATTGVRNLISSVVSFMRELPGKIWGAIVGAVSRVATWGANMKSKAVSAITNMVSSVVATAKSLPGRIWSAISGAISRLAAWGSQMVSKAKSAITNVANTIVNGLKSVPGKMASIGRNIVEGVWNGIKNATSWIKGKVADFAGGVVSGIKDALGIASPSKIMRDQVGKYVAEGLAVGITDNADSPIKALKKIGDEMSAQEFNLNDATINRKLAATFNASAPGAVDSGAALIDKLDSIYQRLSNLQIVLDTGTLVGETIDKIDAGLAGKQLLNARGV